MKEVNGNETPEQVRNAATAAAMAFDSFSTALDGAVKVWEKRGKPDAGAQAIPIEQALLIRNHVLLCTVTASDAIAVISRLTAERSEHLRP